MLYFLVVLLSVLGAGVLCVGVALLVTDEEKHEDIY